jgi:hypothetical protein
MSIVRARRLNFRNLAMFACLATSLSAAPSVAQPYGYSWVSLPDTTGYLPTTEIVRTNLATGQRSHFATVKGSTRSVFWDSDQRWLFHIDGRYLGAIKTSDTNSKPYLFNDVGTANPPLYLHSQNRYLLCVLLDTGGTETWIARVLEAETLNIIDSLSGNVVWGSEGFPSQDESILYMQDHDAVSGEPILHGLSLTTYSFVWQHKLYDIGPATSHKGVEGGKKGKAILSYYYPSLAFPNHYLLEYDPVSGWVSTPSAFPFRSRCMLSPTAYQILAQRVDTNSFVEGGEFRTGDVWIFDAASGHVQQKLKFPSGGDVFVFDSDTSHFYYHVDATDQWIKTSLGRSPAVKGSLYLSPSGTSPLSIKARPSVAFTSSDTLTGTTVTLRWPAQFQGLTIGNITSNYGFAKLDSLITQGGYSYQKFTTSQKVALNWQSGSEYELFNVPVQGMCGAETFELTNALPGGEWFVDVNYTDRTDSVFYQGSAQGFAFQNKSTTTAATEYNSERHLVVTTTKLHEVYVSGGEVIYRRSPDNGITWNTTQRISSGQGGANTSSCIILGSGTTNLYAVWDRVVTGSTMALCFAKSTDEGTTWSTAITLPGCSSLTPSPNQAGSVHPVIGELASTPRHLLVAFADQGGLKYQKSTDNGATWLSSPTPLAPTLHNSSDNPWIWYLSMVTSGSSYLMLSYDYRTFSTTALISRVYTSSSGWSSEASVAASTGTCYDRCSSLGLSISNNFPVIAWCAQKMVNGQLDVDYRILYRVGLSNNTWSSTFTEFAKTQAGVSDVYPSFGYYTLAGYSIISNIYFQTTQNAIRYLQCVGSTWQNLAVATGGNWPASASLNTGNTTRVWTDMQVNPYQVAFTQPGQQGMILASPTGESATIAGPQFTISRKVVLEDPDSHTSLAIELSPIRVVTDKDTVTLPLKALADTVSTTFASVWDYLGTDISALPNGAKSILMDVQVNTLAQADTMSAKVPTSPFTSLAKSFRVDLVQGTSTSTLLTETDARSGRKTLSVPAQYAGKQIRLRAEAGLPSTLSGKVRIGVGNVLYMKGQ